MITENRERQAQKSGEGHAVGRGGTARFCRDNPDLEAYVTENIECRWRPGARFDGVRKIIATLRREREGKGMDRMEVLVISAGLNNIMNDSDHQFHHDLPDDVRNCLDEAELAAKRVIWWMRVKLDELSDGVHPRAEAFHRELTEEM